MPTDREGAAKRGVRSISATCSQKKNQSRITKSNHATIVVPHNDTNALTAHTHCTALHCTVTVHCTLINLPIVGVSANPIFVLISPLNKFLFT